MRTPRLLVLLLVSLASSLIAPAGSAQSTPQLPPSADLSTPIHPQGRQTPEGLIVTSAEDGFSVVLGGHRIQPASADKLQWDIDGSLVELSVLRKPRIGSWVARAAVLNLIATTSGTQIETPGSDTNVPVRQLRKLWSTPDATMAAAEVPAGLLVIRVTPAESEARPGSRDYARRALLSVSAAAATRPDLKLQAGDQETGAPLPGMLRLRSALFGEPSAALINKQLATSSDADLPGVLTMEAGTLADFARWELNLGETAIQVVVFDGRVGHAINLMSYDAVQNAFIYFDPWGKGSFLEAGNNAAGVAAQAHPTQPRLWVLPFASMERVLYALVNSEPDLIETLNLCSLAYAPAQKVFNAYAHAASGKHSALKPAQLEQRARYLYAIGQPQAAGGLLAARVMTHATAVPADLQSLSRQNGLIDLKAYASSLQNAANSPPTTQRTIPPPTLKSVQTTDLFSFFRLRLTHEQAGRSQYRTGSQQFGPLAEVILYTDTAGVITRSELVVSRRFIAAPEMAPFAADLVKSFILFASDPAELAAVQPLTSEIYGRRPKPVLIPGAQHQESTVPAARSPSTQAYYGNLQDYRLLLPVSVLEMHNSGAGAQAELRISMSPR